MNISEVSKQHWFKKYLPKVGCDKCKDGYIITYFEKGNPSEKVCECLLAYEKARDIYNTLLKCSTISEKFWVDATEEKCRTHIKGFETFRKSLNEIFQELGGSVYIHGAMNTGKTLLANYITRKFIEARRTVISYPVGELLERFRCFNEDSKKLFEDCISCDLLVLDDLGTQKDSEWTSSTIYTIINSRYLRGYHTVITGNKTMKINNTEEKELSVLDRIASKIDRSYKFINLIK